MQGPRVGAFVCISLVGGCWPQLEDLEGGLVDAGAKGTRISYRDVVLEDAPLIYWRFGEKSGTTVDDASGHGNDGAYVDDITLGVPGALAGDGDTALAIRGASGFTVQSNGTEPDPTGVAPYTIELWFARANVDGPGGELVTKQIQDQNGRDEETGVGVDPGGATVTFDRYVSGTATQATAPIPAGETFTHVACVYDGTQLRLYLDGVLAKQTPDARPLPPKASHWYIGMAYRDHGIFEGAIDEFAYYASPLSEARIKLHHDVGVGR